MLKAIVYTSNTDHTLNYAKMLSSLLKIPYYNLREARSNLKRNDEIIYMGWIFATKISGISKVNRYKVKCYVGVGIFKNEEEYIKLLKEKNKISGKFFYLRGGINYNKLKGWKRKLLQTIAISLEKEKKEENKELIEIFKNGANFVSIDNLNPIIKYIKNKDENI